MKKQYLLVCLFLSFLTACGSVDNISPDSSDDTSSDDTSSNGDISADEIVGVESVFFFATDFASSGQLYTASMDPVGALLNTEVSLLGSSAGIRLYDGLIYVLHDGFSVGSSDNVQIIDPSNGYTTINQWSTGNGTNPSDIVVIGSKAYITLYNPESDQSGESVDENGHPSDLIVMNLETGAIEKRISFFDFLNDDGNRTGNADQMVMVGDKLYVCLQDLEFFDPNAAGKIGIVNVTTNAVEGVILLQGRNPVSIVYSEDENKIFVANQAPYDFMLGNFDTSLPYGGIEIVSLVGNATTLINDEDLGGYVERLALSADSVFAVVSEMDPETFDFTSTLFKMASDNETAAGASVFLNGSQDVRDIATDSERRLWVSRRSISAGDGLASDPQVEVFDSTGAAVGSPMVPVVPITSIAIGNI